MIEFHVIFVLDWKISGLYRLSFGHVTGKVKLFEVQSPWTRHSTGQYTCMIYCRPGFSNTKLNFTGMELLDMFFI